jgi:4-amino-4-deoxy-L-arabinose transferase-like glycosyltransferase
VFALTPSLRHSLLLVALAALFFMPFLGAVRLFDWDEINFAEAAREMIVLGDYLRVHVDFQPFWEKPPLFFWLQSFSMHLFGIGEYAARFPNAVCGVLTLLLTYHLGAKLYDARFGLLWAGAWLGSILPHLYFRSGIIDPWFNFFIFLGLNGLILFRWKKDRFDLPLPYALATYLLGGGFLLGLAILTKGPVAYLIVALVVGVYWLMGRLKWFITPLHFLLFSLAALIPPGLWFGLETVKNGPWFVTTFLTYNYRLFSTPDAGHAGFPGYHFVVLLLGCFPASVFALRSFGTQTHERLYQRDYKRWMLILFWVVLILFTIVKSKIVHYSSLAYYPITYLAALTLHQFWVGKRRLPGWMTGLLLGIGTLLAAVVATAAWVGPRLGRFRPLFAEDPFAQANLDAHTQLSWTPWAYLPAGALLGVLVLSLRWLRRQQWERGYLTLFLGTALFLTLTLGFFITRVEGISQAAALRFYEQFQGKEVYVGTYGFRSYGPFFYTRRQPGGDPRRTDVNWLLRGAVDRPTYIVAKIMNEAELDTVRTLRKRYAENGFVFYERVSSPR